MSPSHLFFIPLLAFVLTSIGHILALQYFSQWNLLDFPERYGLQRKAIPYPTGVIAVVVFTGFLLYLSPINKQLIGLLIGIGLMSITGFIDDRKQVSAVARICIQLIAAFIIFGCGTRIYTITNPLVADGILKLDTIVIPFALFDNPPLWSGVFTILWLGLTMNSLNWLDGIPGQVSLLSVIGFMTIGFLAHSSRFVHADPALQQYLALLSFTLMGIALSCMLFDFPPNKVLMGDTGAMFFGLMLGVLTIYAGGKVATAFLVLGVPLIDSVLVVIRRLHKGVSPLRGNATDEHLHHRLLQKGWSPRDVICLTAILGISFGGSALFLSTKQKFFAALLLLGVMIVLSWYSKPGQSESQKARKPES